MIGNVDIITTALWIPWIVGGYFLALGCFFLVAWCRAR